MNPDSLQNIIDAKGIVANVLGDVIFWILTISVILGGIFWRKLKDFIFAPVEKFGFSDQFLENATEFFVANDIEIEGKTEVVQDSMNYFVNTIIGKEGNHFYCILAPTGMGKTTFLANLYLAYQRKSRFSFSAKHLIFGDIRAEKFWKKIAEIKKADKEDDYILLIDALDEFEYVPKEGEDYYSQSRKRLEQLIQDTQGFLKVIVSVREQFFHSIYEEPSIISGSRIDGKPQVFTKIRLQPFDRTEKRAEYLKKRYPKKQEQEKVQAFLRKAADNDSIKHFTSPLMLNYLELIWDTKKELRYSYDIYEAITDAWLEREDKKSGRDIAPILIDEKPVPDFLGRCCMLIAYQLHDDKKTQLKSQELILLEKNIITKLKDLSTRSLLIRKKDDFSFVHRSFLEFFLAKLAVQFPSEEPEIDFSRYDFAAQMLIGKRWRELKHKAPQSRSRGWLDFFKNLSCNHWVQKGIRERFKEILEKEDLEHEQVLTPFINNEVLELDGYVFQVVKGFCKSCQTLTIGNCEIDDTVTLVSSLKELKNLKYLSLKSNQLTNIDALKELKNLEYLRLDWNQITNIQVLKELKNLRVLSLGNNKINETPALKRLTSLRRLELDDNQISNIEELKELINLTWLGIANNQISNIESLKELKNLTSLFLSNNQISNIEPLKELKNLTSLFLSNNQISNIEPLKELINLTWLGIANNQISNIESLKELKNLTNLYLAKNQTFNMEILKELRGLNSLHIDSIQLQNIEVLKTLKNLESINILFNGIKDITVLKELKSLKILFLGNNSIHDISILTPILKELKNLTYLSLSKNEISEIVLLKDASNLEQLFLDNNQINDISVIKELKNLRCLHIYENKIADLSPLFHLPKLFDLRISNNPITDTSQIEALRARGVSVTF